MAMVCFPLPPLARAPEKGGVVTCLRQSASMYVLACLLLVVLFSSPTHGLLYEPMSEEQHGFTPAYLVSGGSCPAHPQPRPLDSSALPPSIVTALETLNKTLQSDWARLKLRGTHFAVVYDQEVIWSQGYGFVRGHAGAAPDLNTIFRIGSISKVFVDLLMMQMRDAGIIDLEDPVEKWAPSFKPRSPFGTSKPITLRQLGSHLAGLPREAPCLAWSVDSVCNITTEEMFARLSEQYLILPPDSLPSYSNLGFSALGNVLGSILSSRSWPSSRTQWTKLRQDFCQSQPADTCAFESAVMESVVAPLAMNATFFYLNEHYRQQLATGYMYGVIAPQFDEGWTGPAGQMYSSNADLAKLLSLLFRTNKPQGGTQVLDGSTIREWLLPRYINNDQATGYGVPWEYYISDEHQYWMATKGGYVPGYTSKIIAIPELKLGLSVLSATGPPTGVGALAFDAAKILVPALHDYFDTFAQAPPLPATAQEYFGDYRLKKGPLFLPATVSISASSNNTAHLVASVLSFYTVQDSVLVRTPQVDGSLDYFTMVPNRSASGDTFAPSCMSREGGYYYQHVVFHRSNSTSEPCALTIPGLYYGFIFYKEHASCS